MVRKPFPVVGRRVFRPEVDGLEERSLLSTFTVTNLLDSGAGSLRQEVALANLNPGTDTVVIAPAVTGTIHLTGGAIAVTDIVTITRGGVASGLVIDAGHTSRIFDISAASCTIQRMTMQNGMDSEAVSNSAGGGAIRLTGGGLGLNGDVFSGNVSTVRGGAVFSNYGVLAQNGCTYVGNTAQFDGGAIFNSGSMTDTGSFYANNVAHYSGGAIANEALIPNFLPVGATLIGDVFLSDHADRSGGGVFAANGVSTVINFGTFVSNTALEGGGFDQAEGNGGEVRNSVFLSNSSSSFGGGIASRSNLLVTGSTFQGNSALFGGGIWAKLGTLSEIGNTYAFNVPDNVVQA